MYVCMCVLALIVRIEIRQIVVVVVVVALLAIDRTHGERKSTRQILLVEVDYERRQIEARFCHYNIYCDLRRG